MTRVLFLTAIAIFFISCKKKSENSTTQKNIEIIAYYSGDAEGIDQHPIEKLTQIIYSFLHLKGNKLAVDNAADSLTIHKLSSLKNDNPQLKVLLSLGGWGGCKTCSEVFSTEAGRQEFAHSLKHLLELYDTDGIDLDWEYPAIEGFPGHQYLTEDRSNFTQLVKTIRETIGDSYIISFAAGGFKKYLEQSIEWLELMPYLDYVNIMSYDLVHGYSTVTGHHCPLYSTAEQSESADFAVKYLDSIGFPKDKMVIGSAFYARIWENVEPENNGLYQEGKFKHFWCYFKNKNLLTEQEGYSIYWDSLAQAAYKYNPEKKLFATYDDPRAIALKTQYAIDNGLGGIMFWELKCDTPSDGLLNVIYETTTESSASSN